MYTLYEIRTMKRKTQKDLADLIKKSVPSYRKIERNPHLASIEQADAICAELGVTMGEINWRERKQ
jgi:transcriptional regulator with XRE-family HTH domain